ncbi:hypothetical protein [Guggenheimella bovis]
MAELNELMNSGTFEDLTSTLIEYFEKGLATEIVCYKDEAELFRIPAVALVGVVVPFLRKASFWSIVGLLATGHTLAIYNKQGRIFYLNTERILDELMHIKEDLMNPMEA